MPTPPHRDDNLGFWRGQVTSRLDTMDDSVKRLEASLEVVKRELVESNMKIARYVGAVGVLLALLTMLAPYLTKVLFGATP